VKVIFIEQDKQDNRTEDEKPCAATVSIKRRCPVAVLLAVALQDKSGILLTSS